MHTHRDHAETLPFNTPASITVADLIDDVKSTHRSILSQNALEHFNEERPKDGYWTNRVLFSQLGLDTDNPIYRSGVEEADYAEALPDGYSEYDIVQEMLSDARGAMNDFKGNTKLKAELDEEVRQQIGERRTGTGERRTALSRASRRSEPNFRQNNKNGVFLPRKW
ncbi:MAG: hypothetical protein MJ074_01810 [Oscillospiraceae bacterium]|nr:hypothetical protein [Oscillospiraceae bacterium]